MNLRSLAGIPAFLAGLALAGGAYTLGRTWRRTSQTEFCLRCHEMRPFAAAWKAGPHGEIPCSRCHGGESLPEKAAAKARGLVFLASHRQGYQGSPQAVVGDRTCQAPSCHPRGGKDGVTWRGLLFHHSLHRKTGRKVLGKELRCTLCHGRTLERGHGTALREEACLACHLEGGGLPEGRRKGDDGACLTCHAMPPTVRLAPRARLDHARAREAGLSCRDCHSTLFPRGSILKEGACRSCHPGAGRRAREAAFRNPGEVHRIHVLRSSLGCRNCHASRPHRLPSPWLEADTPPPGEACPHWSGRTRKGRPRAFVRVDCRLCHQGGAHGGALKKGRCGLCHDRPPAGKGD